MPATRSNAYIAGIAFVVLFVGSISLVLIVHGPDNKVVYGELSWWKKTLIYHVYVPSFSDADGDGIGDLRGLTEKLDYIQDLGVESIWLSSIYEFGGVDYGNDITDHKKIDPLFGTEDDFEALLREVDKRGMKLILDFIPNHTSNKHPWFEKSENQTAGYEDYYIWRNEPNNWTGVMGDSAWTKSKVRNEYYLHNYLPDMPELNLTNPKVREELKDILRFYLSKQPIMGFHISGFNILIGNEAGDGGQLKDMMQSDVNETIKFLNEIHELTKEFSANDTLDRLIMLEMVEDELETFWRDEYLEVTAGVAVVPFSFGSFPVLFGKARNLTGLVIYDEIQKYLQESPKDNFWPCWEMNDHDIVRGLGRFPIHLNNIFFMINLLLPGTSVIYYGDEIGMSNNATNLKWSEVQDPYTKDPYCNKTLFEKDECICRDPSRTPMQWDSSENAGFTNCSGENPGEACPWLPIAGDYEIYNVKNQEHSLLETFRNISKLREMEAFKSGEVYFPFHDEQIFSFLRKSEQDDKGFIVVIFVVDINYGTKDIIQNHRIVDFTNILPNFPHEGVIVAASDHTDKDHQHIGSVVDMSAVKIDPSEGLVIELDFSAGEDEDKANVE